MNNLTQNQIILIILVILYLSIMGIVIKILRQRDRKLAIMKYEIDISNGPIFQTEQQLDLLIDSIFNEYKIYNLEFRDNAYIKEMEEKQIIQDVSDMVLERISPVFLTQLSTYFNIDNLGNIIANKISLRVMEYRITKNTEG